MSKHILISEMVKRLNTLSVEDITKIHEQVFSESAFDPEKDGGVVISEEVSTLLEGAELSEEMMTKTVAVFEAAVNEKVATKTTEISESLEVTMKESIETAIEELTESVDSYLTKAAKTWLDENEVALDNNIRVDVAEQLIASIKEAFGDHNVTLPEGGEKEIADLKEEIESLKDKLDTVVAENIELQKVKHNDEIKKVFEGVTEGLTDSQVEKLEVLSEDMDTSDLDKFKSKLEIIKESFLGEKTEKKDETVKEDAKAKTIGQSYSDAFALMDV